MKIFKLPHGRIGWQKLCVFKQTISSFVWTDSVLDWLENLSFSRQTVWDIKFFKMSHRRIGLRKSQVFYASQSSLETLKYFKFFVDWFGARNVQQGLFNQTIKLWKFEIFQVISQSKSVHEKFFLSKISKLQNFEFLKINRFKKISNFSQQPIEATKLRNNEDCFIHWISSQKNFSTSFCSYETSK